MKPKEKWRIKEIDISDETGVTQMDMIIKWEGRTIDAKYIDAEYMGNAYISKTKEISSDKVGEKLATVQLKGYNDTANEYNYANGNAFKLNGISEKYAIAIQFEGDANYYLYENTAYEPETLRELVEDTNLKEISSLSKIIYYEEYTEGYLEKLDTIEFPDVKNDVVWKELFNKVDLDNKENNQTERYAPLMELKLDIPILKDTPYTIVLSRKGYLSTDLISTGRVFNIGEENIQDFIDYIINKFDGYKLVYVDKSLQNEQNTDDKIMMVENTIGGSEPKEVDMNSIKSNENVTVMENKM